MNQPLTPEQKLEEIACILDDLWEPEPMQTCMSKLMGIWFQLRSGSSNVGIIRAAVESRRNQG